MRAGRITSLRPFMSSVMLEKLFDTAELRWTELYCTVLYSVQCTVYTVQCTLYMTILASFVLHCQGVHPNICTTVYMYICTLYNFKVYNYTTVEPVEQYNCTTAHLYSRVRVNLRVTTRKIETLQPPSPTILHSTIVYSVLYSTKLYYIVLSTVLYYTLLYCTLLYSIL